MSETLFYVCRYIVCASQACLVQWKPEEGLDPLRCIPGVEKYVLGIKPSSSGRAARAAISPALRNNALTKGRFVCLC